MAQNNVFNPTRIDTLNKTNYDTWRIQVQVILVKNDAWAYVQVGQGRQQGQVRHHSHDEPGPTEASVRMHNIQASLG